MINNKNIYVVISFDAEADIGYGPSYNGLLKATPILLDILKKAEIKSTFFFVGYAAKLFPDICKEVFDHGHEIGCHSLNHETVGDPLYEIPGHNPLLPGEIRNRIEIATNSIEKIIGKRPFSFRAPRGWSSTECIRSLEELGYKTDSSYLMGNYNDKQLVPYHPSENNWLEKGEMKILEIPCFADITIKNPNILMSSYLDQWPLWRTKGAKTLMNHVKNFVRYVRNKDLPVILCFYFHPFEFVKTKSTIDFTEGLIKFKNHAYKNTGKYAIKEFIKLIFYLKEENVIFLTANDLAMNY